MSNGFWFSPENLEKQENELEKEFLQKGNLSRSSDFRSYLELNLKNDSSDIHLHNMSIQLADLHFSFLKEKLQENKLSAQKILELGCGAGFSTAGLKNNFSTSTIVAVDASRNAIEYASRLVRGVAFKALGVDQNTNFGEHFDLAIAWEFYPFSRTDSYEFQKAMIQKILSQTSILVIANLDNGSSIFNNYSNLLKDFHVLGHKPYICPKYKVFKYFRNQKVSAVLSRILSVFFPKKFLKLVVISAVPH